MNREQKQEFVNDKYVEDWEVSGGKVIPDFKGYMYEKKFSVRTTGEIQRLLDQKHYWKDKISKLVSACKLEGATCRIDFGRMKNIDIDIQKKIIDFQAEIFDDITIQLIGENIADFKEVLQYAIKKHPKIPKATHADLRTPLRVLDEYHEIVAETFDENKDYLKYQYRKVTTWLNQYIAAKKHIKNVSAYAVLTGCNKRCGIDQYRNVAVSIMATAKLGFNASCIDVRIHKKGFAVYVDVFNPKTWEFDKMKTKDAKEVVVDMEDLDLPEFRKVRIVNYDKINQALKRLSSEEINKRDLVKSLFDHLAAEGL